APESCGGSRSSSRSAGPRPLPVLHPAPEAGGAIPSLERRGHCPARARVPTAPAALPARRSAAPPKPPPAVGTARLRSRARRLRSGRFRAGGGPAGERMAGLEAFGAQVIADVRHHDALLEE